MKRATSKPGLKSIPSLRRRAVGTSKEEWVTVRPLYDEWPHPTLITPKVEGLSLNDWASENAEYIEKLWEDKQALLFRDFDLGGKAGFQAFTDIAANSDRLPYVDRSTPREEHGPNIYCSTIYPNELSIRLHNEGSYWTVHPKKAFFCCITAAETGGETPIGDMQAVYERIDPQIRGEFAARKWMLARNYNEGFALTWQDVFQTTDRAEVDAYCRENDIIAEWKGEDRLRTKQIREPIMLHPRTGAPLWHNHAAFFHITSREADVRDALLHEFSDDDLPYNTYYGDGGEIPADVIEHINDAYEAERVKFAWQEGDVLMIDNCRIAHGREPYTGERLTLVALMEGFVPNAG